MSDKNQAVIEIASAVSSTASKTTYIGAYGGVVGWLLSIDWLPWLGFVIAFSGFIVNLYFKRLENKRAEEMHKLKIQELLKNEIN